MRRGRASFPEWMIDLGLIGFVVVIIWGALRGESESGLFGFIFYTIGTSRFRYYNLLPSFFLLQVAAGALMRWYVLRLGLRTDGDSCPKCGYDLRFVDHRRCPECGAAVSD